MVAGCRKLNTLPMRKAQVILITLALGLTHRIARAGSDPATLGETTATKERSAWLRSVEKMAGAIYALGVTTQLDVPEAVERVSTILDVQLRNAVRAGERWVASLGEKVATDLHLPDLSALSADPVKGIESSGFGWRVDPIDGGGKFHKGTDYKADRGTPVYAAGTGLVAFAGRQEGYGKVIYIDHGGGLVTRYAHLREIGVTRGQVVTADALIGEVGSTGRTTGPHLHFEIRIDGRAVDPVLAMDVAEIQRTGTPGMARVAAMSLTPELQRRKRDRHSPRIRDTRPERTGRTESHRDQPSS